VVRDRGAFFSRANDGWHWSERMLKKTALEVHEEQRDLASHLRVHGPCTAVERIGEVRETEEENQVRWKGMANLRPSKITGT
jgi:hypothetical protein